MAKNRNLDAALIYANLGWSVFPVHTVDRNGKCSCGKPNCQHPGKHPIGALTPKGFLDASSNKEVIEEWLQRCPWMNLGIPTGKINGIIVQDVDPRNGGLETLETMLVGSTMPLTPTVDTGGGGQHYFFAYPDEGAIPSRCLGPGLDLKSDGGYVIAPFSRHASGQFYEWRREHSPLTLPLASTLDWQLQPSGLYTASHDVGEGTLTEGSRNDRLFRDASAMRRRGMSTEIIFTALQGINTERCSPLLDDQELQHIAASTERYPPEPGLMPGEAPAKQERPSPLDITVLSTTDLLRPIAEPEWVIPGWKTKGGLTLLAGNWGSGKSFIALALAINQARIHRKEANFLHFLSLKGPAQRIVYIDEENPLQLIQRRIAQIRIHLRINDAEWKEMDFHYLPWNTLNLDDEARYRWLRAYLDRIKPDEVFYDSLSRFHKRQENQNSEMSRFFSDKVQPISTLGIAQTFLHHLGKQSAQHPRDMGDLIRGASDICAFFHDVWGLDYDRAETRTLELVKTRWGARPPKLNITFTEDDDTEGIELRAFEAKTETDSLIWTLLEDSKHAGVSRQGLLKALQQDGLAHQTAKRLLSRTLQRYTSHRVVVKRKEGKETRYWLSEFAPAR